MVVGNLCERNMKNIMKNIFFNNTNNNTNNNITNGYKCRPNIVLFMCDQLRYDALGCYGNHQIHTPHIDSIALNGSTFDNHFVQNPVCSPSRCAVMTGRYPKNHGTRDNGIPLRDSEITLAEVLRDNGYVTAAIGKMHLTAQCVPKEDEQEDWPEDRYGFDVIHTTCDCKTGEYLDWLKRESGKDYEEVKSQGERKMKEDKASAADKEVSGPPQVYRSNIDPKYHQSHWIADRMIELIEESREDKPFFAFCSFVDPHHPFDPPEPYAGMYDPDKLAEPFSQEGELEDKPPHFQKARTGRGYSNEKYDYRKLTAHEWGEVKAAYYGMITLIDDNIGRILKAMEEKGIEKNTLIMFTNDHGELLGDHGLLFKGPFHYDAVIKAPMLVKWPEVIPKGSRYSQVTEHVDIMPTLLEYAGIRPPYGVQGSSMAPVLRGDKGAGRSYAMTEFNCYDWGLSVKTLTGKDYKLTCYAGETWGELYDRNADPDEAVNLWDNEAYAHIKELMLKKLMDRIIETEDPLPLRIGKY